MADIRYPTFAKNRGAGFWLKPRNILASQRTLRLDYSNEWRYTFGAPNPPDRSVQISRLITPAPNGAFRFVILGDTGEGDRSQYGLVPFIRALKPNFMIINGDVAYPAGRTGSGNRDDDDFLSGLFEPYRNLGIPIWATPGNHEYYSTGNGQDFYEVFCTRKFDNQWSRHGLPHPILQPGTFWELRDDRSKLVVIGLDSGKTANLDGDNSWWQFWKRHIEPDTTQHSWLDNRLRKAQLNGESVILLFHIPALVDESHKEANLHTLHRILADYSCISLVICGHEHNFQSYSSATFAQYLKDEHTKPVTPSAQPHYLVAGSSGAALASTDFKGGKYQSVRYPSANDWKDIASAGRKVVSGLGLSSTVVGQVVRRVAASAADDGDVAIRMSLVVVDVQPPPFPSTNWSIVARPGLMNDLDDLFAHLPKNMVVDVTAPNLPVDQGAVNDCLTRHAPIRVR